MDPKAKDIIATGAGGGIGVDLFWTGLDGIVRAVQSEPPQDISVMDCKWMVYGLIAAYLGFLAWRDDRKKLIQQTTTITQEVTKQP